MFIEPASKLSIPLSAVILTLVSSDVSDLLPARTQALLPVKNSPPSATDVFVDEL